MIRLYESYPESVRFEGREIPLDLDFRQVLRVLDLQKDKSWTELERVRLSVLLLLKDPADCPETAERQGALLSAVFALFPGPEGEDSGEKCMDFNQDAALIRSGFFRIGVDLTRERVHFFRFLELLADLPEDTALIRTINIRKKPLPKPNKHNAEEIAALQRAKARVALKLDEEERRGQFIRSLKQVHF